MKTKPCVFLASATQVAAVNNHAQERKMNMNTKISLLAAGMFLVASVTGFGQPVITSQPQSVTNLAGSAATFFVTATGTPPLAYQWFFNSTIALTAATNADLILTNVQSLNAGGYSVAVTNAEGSVTSVVAALTVLTPPRFIRQPVNQTASLFADATFRVTVNGDAPLSYQWRFNDGDLIGMTNTTLTVTNVERANAGNYSVVVTNLSGSVTSQVATLTITPFNSIYCFGFSWTDTHNCDWPPLQYYHRHACNGPMWPEFLSTNLGLAYVEANNYAHCGANSTAILNQVINFPVPPKPKLSLYCLWHEWPGDTIQIVANALTNEVAGNRLIQTSISNYSNSVNRLYAKGARIILFQGEFGTPVRASDFGTNSGLFPKAIEFFARFDSGLIDTIKTYSQTRPDLRLLIVDEFQNYNDVLAHPAQYGFTEAIIPALDDPALKDKSFTGPGADYVQWDCCHVTSKFHKLIAAWNLETLTNSILEKLEAMIASGSPTIQMNRLQIGRDYTLQKSAGLKGWQEVTSFTASAGSNLWSNTEGNEPTAYFRLSWRR